MSENIPPENVEDNFVQVEEPKQIIKRPVSDEKRKQLEKARIKPQEKKKESKQLNIKSKQLHIEEAKVKQFNMTK